jgi:hypothetical protein
MPLAGLPARDVADFVTFPRLLMIVHTAPAVAAVGRAEAPGLPSVIKVRAPVVAPEALPEIPDLDVPRPPPAPEPVPAPTAEPVPEPAPVEAAPVVAPAPPPSAPASPAAPPARHPHRGSKVDPAQLSLFDPPKK